MRNTEDFPKENFVPVGGTLTLEEGEFYIEVPIRPFLLDGEMVSTSFRLEFIDFGTEDVKKLAGRVFTFPINPEEGYIDGSIYLGDVHNAADVTQIAFGSYDRKTIDATLTMRIDFESEGARFKNIDLVLATSLAVTDEL